jgi:predicted transposase/invertase (TIGR01784 family)
MKAKYVSPFTDFGFKKLFGEEASSAEIAKYSPEEMEEYRQSLKIYRDLNNVIDTAFGDGEIFGKKAVAKNLKDEGMEISLIMKMTGLTREEIEEL